MAKNPVYTKKTADRHALYQLSVQEPEADVHFLNRVFKKRFGRRPRTLLEDFCGTAYLCCEWVRSHRERRAVGIDLDPEPLAWGREHNLGRLKEEQRGRVELIEGDVLRVETEPADLRVGFNFSYCLFLTRPDLLAYFARARASMGPESLFVIDLHGGPEAQQSCKERKRKKGFTYVWEQGELNPIDGRMRCSISFEFRDGTAWKRAFRYDWRLWHLTELRDALADAGFSETEVYWEGTDEESGEGNGIYRRAKKATNDPSWIAYIVAIP